MLNIVPISTLTAIHCVTPESISCPICHADFISEQNKAAHLDATHPGWALTMMFGFLRQIPRENG